MTDVPFAVSGNARADGTKRRRTGELISCPELAELRTPIKALRNPGPRPDPESTLAERFRCDAQAR